jgi:hypothetical protein
LSNTNRVAIRAAVEASFGIVPTAPDMRDLCITGAPSLAFTPETTTSEKIRSDRQIDDLPLVGGEAGGDINSELAFSVQDFLLEGAFFNDFQIRNARLNDESTTEITAVTASAFTVLTGSVPVVNDIVRGEGFNVAGNNAYHVIDGVPSATSFTSATANVEATPPLQARLTTVGHRAAAGDLVLTIAGLGGTLASTILDLTALGLQAGDWIALDGFPGTPANEGFYRISISPATNLITFDIVPVGSASETPAGSADIYMGERLINGTTFQSYTLEEQFGDHTPITYQYFRGMTVDGMVLTAPSQAIVSVVFTFSGKDAFFSETGLPGSVPDQLPAVDAGGRVDLATTITALPVNVLNSSSNVARISRGGVPITGANFVLEASIEIANNLRQLNAVGFLGAVDIGDGEFGVTGSLNTYFDDSSLARDVVSNAETSFDMRFVDSSGHAIVIDAPRIKFSEGAPEVPSKNEDVTLALSYQAIRQPVFNYTLLWQRFTGFQKSN